MDNQFTGISSSLFLHRCLHVYSLLLLLLFPFYSAAQSQLSTEHFGIEEGLSHRWVHQVIQDRDGFLWLATEGGGMCRFDGHTFQVFPLLEDGTKDLKVESIQESRDGMIWVKKGGEETVPIIFDPTIFQYKIAEKGRDFFVPSQVGKQIIQTPFLQYLPDMEEVRFHSLTNIDDVVDWQRFKGLLRGYKTYGTETIITKHEGKEIWLWHNHDERGPNATLPQQYTHFNLVERTWEAFELEVFLKINIVNQNLPIDSKGRFWYPSFEKKGSPSFDFFQLPRDIPLDEWLGIRVDNRQNIWIYNRHFDLFRWDMVKKKLENFGKLENVRMEVHEDREGTIWIGTETGLRKIRRRKQLFETCLDRPVLLGKPLPFGNSMSHILEAGNGQVYSNKGFHHLFQIDPKTLTAKSVVNIAQYFVKGNNDCFYVRGDRNDNWKIHTAPFRIQKFMFDVKQGGAELGLTHKIPFAMSPKTHFILLDTLTNELVTPSAFLHIELGYTFWDKEHHAFYGNYKKGMLRIDLKDYSKEYIELWPQANLNFIRAWLPEKDGLWLGTLDGLKWLDLKTKTITKSHTIADGLPHNTIYSMVRSGENLWLGTNNGLCCFNPETLNARNFYVEDGLTHNEFNTYSTLLASDGRIWMGGLNGLNIFDPKALEKIEEEESRLMLTSFSKYDKEIDSTVVLNHLQILNNGSLSILPQETSFTFQFFLNSLLQPGKHRYYWYMEGMESAWSNVSDKPVATYRYMPPGRYILKVKATDSRGNPAVNELAIPVKVFQAWYLRWWAWAIYALLLTGAAFGFYRFKVNRELEQQEAMRLKELDTVKSKLYTNITHEFRTPLTVILGITEQLAANSPHLAAGNKEQKKLEQNLASVNRNGQNLLRLVNQMLDLSKLEAGKLSLHLVQADIVHYIRYIASSFHSFAAMKEVELKLHTALETCLMDFDKDKTLNIVSNLLSNAIKFTPPGGEVKLDIQQSQVHLSKPEIGQSNAGSIANAPISQFRFSVADTGTGIPAEKLPHIFDRFYQVDDSHTRKGEGTGIGLTLVKELVKLMNGEISVESEEGKGTTFTVVLPVTNQAPLATSDMDRSPLLGHAAMTQQMELVAAPENGELPILLIVEDNADVAQYIQSCLENEYQIQYAVDGQLGIDLAIEQVPDIIISDVMMPNKDGFQLVHTLKNDERTSHIPIVLLTAKADVASKIEGLEQGADAYLAKPFNQQELRVRLAKLVELREKLQRRYSVHPLQVGTKPASKTPTSQAVTQPPSMEDAFLIKTNSIIESHLSDSTFGTAELCRELGMSKTQLYRKLKALTDRSIALHIRSVRLQKGKFLLETTNLTIAETAYKVGFSDPFYFSRTFSEEFGVSPSSIRN